MKKVLRWLGLLVAGLLVVVVGFVGGCFFRFSMLLGERYPMHPELAAKAQTGLTPDIALGKRIFHVRNGCVHCHGENLAGKKLLENGAMGTIYSANITPFRTKDMKDEDLLRAIRYGVHTSGRSLRFMPVSDFDGMSRGDLDSLVAYIRSVPEVKEPTHESTYGPVAKILSATGKMPVMFAARMVDQSLGMAEKPPEGPTKEFGKYLAKSCSGCHGAEYRGGKIIGGPPDWPPAANIRMGAGTTWTQAAFLDLIKSGVSRKSGQKIRQPMPIDLLQQMDATELEALWKFFSSLDG